MNRRDYSVLYLLILFPMLFSCNENKKQTSPEAIAAINLKKGEAVLCGPPGKEFGYVNFDLHCADSLKATFNLALALLHSFEYDESEKMFAKIIDEDPRCAMAYWGVAMSNYHPLWAPPSLLELQKGFEAIEIARHLQSSEKESDFINATASYFTDWDKLDHHTRCLRFEKSTEKMYLKYPEDNEAALFYVLALNAAANPADTSLSNQRKAGRILSEVSKRAPNHPGVIHYLIHSYDYPQLAVLALPAARQYAMVAPSSAHAQHMPSHIFTRLGLWQDCIESNRRAASFAKCYAENVHMKGHWDEELHAMDYLVYGFLQQGANDSAEAWRNYLESIDTVYPVNFKDAYAFASIPCRYLLENKSWSEAAIINIHPTNFPWKNFPWQNAIIYFTRALGQAHGNHLAAAKSELDKLKQAYDTLTSHKEIYQANQVNIQIQSADAWINYKEGNLKKAVEKMSVAADMEDATEKHPVTPGEIIPARELFGDLLMGDSQYASALQAYEKDLRRNPNRFNGLHGAALAAEKMNNVSKAAFYYKQLLSVSVSRSPRQELVHAKRYLKEHGST